ncbi:hypothetical protein ACJJV6_14450 [Arthrobacter nitrophenolicus]|uniref:Uncharacterized protein n=2 Tax=Arthrobacter nitrophenolicus TaxID=683150 RepID=A0ACC6TBI4_9MICC|nr:hypothetical protein [Arthrobacter nitrophenolicus]ELT46192.1 hypothetical protein G205_00515 [Arthrobacter nitrophenolicus]
MHKKSLLGAAVCTLALVGSVAAPATAAGQSERGPEHANSICSFSGLNDDPNEEYPFGGRVQSYGQLIKLPEFDPAFAKSIGEHPGMACNGHLMPYPEAFHPPAP